MSKVDVLIETSAKVLQLWDWVGERKDSAIEAQEKSGLGTPKYMYELKITAYQGVKEKMRTLFAGLIDFESTGETDGERLPEDV